MNNFYISIISIFLMSILFFPILKLSNSIYGLSQKFLITIITYTHIISVGWLYFKKDTYNVYGWNSIKDFDFTFLNLIISYLPLYIFMLLFLFFFYLFNLLFSVDRSYLSQIKIFNLTKIIRVNLPGKILKDYSSLIYILGFLSIILSYFILISGKGFLGVIINDPLPFKLIGISYYLIKFIIPITNSILFILSRNKKKLFFFIFFVSLIAGSSQLSRSTFLIGLIIPIITLLIFSKSNLFKLIIVFMLSFGLYHIGSIRDLIYSSLNPDRTLSVVPIANWHMHFFLSISNIFTSDFWLKSLNIFMGIISRISPAQGIILGNQFNIDLVGGSFEIFKGIIYHGFQNIPEHYFYVWMGTDLPKGFAHGGGIFSLITALWHYNKFLFVISSIYLCLWCKFFDFITFKFYKLGPLLIFGLNFLSIMVLIIWIGNLSFYLYILILIILFLFHKFNFRNID